MKRILAILVLSLGFGSAAKADHYYATADPNVLQAINQIMTTLGQGCNMGNAQACNAIPLLQQQAQMMLSAGYDCQMQGNPNACNFYQRNIWQLQAAQQQVQMAAQQGRFMQPTGNAAPGMGMTHAQRMQQIHDFGAQNTANFNQRSKMMDDSHKKFIQMIQQ